MEYMLDKEIATDVIFNVSSNRKGISSVTIVSVKLDERLLSYIDIYSISTITMRYDLIY